MDFYEKLLGLNMHQNAAVLLDCPIRTRFGIQVSCPESFLPSCCPTFLVDSRNQYSSCYRQKVSPFRRRATFRLPYLPSRFTHIHFPLKCRYPILYLSQGRVPHSLVSTAEIKSAMGMSATSVHVLIEGYCRNAHRLPRRRAEISARNIRDQRNAAVNERLHEA